MSEIVNFRKLAEVGFNGIFEATMEDGCQVIARLPYPQPLHYAVASEVATLDYLALHGLPVLKVFRSCSKARNPVGAEYIIMEKIKGTPLGEIWYSTMKEQWLIMEQIVGLERQLFSLQLPANGSIYYRDDLESEEMAVSITGLASHAEKVTSASDPMHITAGGTKSARPCALIVAHVSKCSLLCDVPV